MVEVMTGIGRQIGVIPDAPKLRVAGARSGRLTGPPPYDGRGIDEFMFRLAHLSDPASADAACTAAPADRQARDGLLQLVAHRVHLHVPEALAGIVADIEAQQPDHVALTGDLVNISLPTEFSRAAQWLATLGSPHDVTVIPGNHDVYVATAWPENLGLWGAYIASDGPPPPPASTSSRPCAGADRVALVGLSSGVPSPPCSPPARWARRRSPRPSGCWRSSVAKACAGSC